MVSDVLAREIENCKLAIANFKFAFCNCRTNSSLGPGPLARGNGEKRAGAPGGSWPVSAPAAQGRRSRAAAIEFRSSATPFDENGTKLREGKTHQRAFRRIHAYSRTHAARAVRLDAARSWSDAVGNRQRGENCASYAWEPRHFVPHPLRERATAQLGLRVVGATESLTPQGDRTKAARKRGLEKTANVAHRPDRTPAVRRDRSCYLVASGSIESKGDLR